MNFIVSAVSLSHAIAEELVFQQQGSIWADTRVCDDAWSRSKASPGVSGNVLPLSERLSADDDFLDELIGDIGNISNVITDDTAAAVTSDDQLLLEMQELLSW